MEFRANCREYHSVVLSPSRGHYDVSVHSILSVGSVGAHLLTNCVVWSPGSKYVNQSH